MSNGEQPRRANGTWLQPTIMAAVALLGTGTGGYFAVGPFMERLAGVEIRAENRKDRLDKIEARLNSLEMNHITYKDMGEFRRQIHIAARDRVYRFCRRAEALNPGFNCPELDEVEQVPPPPPY